jgi:methylmalonyl-CoA mutase cobalamin-binding subunit
LRRARQCHQHHQSRIHRHGIEAVSRISSLRRRYRARRHQEDVAAIEFGYNAGTSSFADVVRQLRKCGADEIALGGGRTISHQDAAIMKRKGPTSFCRHLADRMVDYVEALWQTLKRRANSKPDPRSRAS